MITKNEQIVRAFDIANRNLHRFYGDWLEADHENYLVYLHQMILAQKWEEDLDEETFRKQWKNIQIDDTDLNRRFVNLRVMDAAANRIHERVFA